MMNGMQNWPAGHGGLQPFPPPPPPPPSHAPLVQDPPFGHTLPHTPQFFESLRTSTHVGPQHTLGTVQCWLAPPHPHALSKQPSPESAQLLPHAPQLRASFVRLRQPDVQHVVPAPQLPPPMH
jgi:hypothetical protein